ncbi:hypothetical protein DFP72DRAFT_1082869 [Ephemerocybe angulata]|uniref:Uncharacterized protein n=1 Tax=Ephemerocybe angulata TaxID=980116 RepID=A0A8H6H7J6_9AGAR|nr:hypothetical protein DFP72DRAFT_1082869 [Tulosesus angulatus]
MRLLYVCARWHALAKLRMQTEATIVLLEITTAHLGDQLRHFRDVTAPIKTVELAQEAKQREKKEAKKKDSDTSLEDPSLAPPPETLHVATEEAQQQPGSQAPLAETLVPLNGPQPDSQPTSEVLPEKKKRSKRQAKQYGLGTIKFHALGHYPQDIRRFGPTDLYSTEWGEFFHKTPKMWAKRTSRRYLRKELSQHECRRMRLHKAKHRILSGQKSSAKAEEILEQRRASRNPEIHHYISSGSRLANSIWMRDFSQVGVHAQDPVCKTFIRDLKEHLLPRFVTAELPGIEPGDLAEIIQNQELDWSNVTLKGERFHSHKIMRIKYTTYEARRNEDIIHLDTDQCNIMLLDPEYSYGPISSSNHPFRYGKVIGIYHANVGYIGPIGRDGIDFKYHSLEFLWVRWYKPIPASNDSELDRAELLPIEETGSHSFVNPGDVLRACHIVPHFAQGLKHPGQPDKSALARDGLDWKKYFINRFVDRDMFMRYEWGLAVGHTYTHQDATARNLQIIALSTSHWGKLEVWGPDDDTLGGSRTIPNNLNNDVEGEEDAEGDVEDEGGFEYEYAIKDNEGGYSYLLGESEWGDEDAEGEDDDGDGESSYHSETDVSTSQCDSDEDEREAAMFGD